MSTRGLKKKRRVEQLQDSPVILRRSPRLSQKFRSYVVSDNPLITTSFSRSSLSSYRTTESNILNESGQSVPSNFDQDDFVDSHSSVAESLAGVTHDHSYAKGALEKSDLASQDLEDEQTTLLDHINHYGPDTSEDEGVSADYIDEDRVYNYKYNKERILTPPKIPEPVAVAAFETPLYYTALALVVHLLYRIGSILYLAVTGVLCWDVTFLSWARQDCFKTLRSLGGFWILLAIFSALGCIMIAPFVEFTSCPLPPPTPAPPPPLPPSSPQIPTLSRSEVEEVVEDMFGTHFQEVENGRKELGSSLEKISLLVNHTHGELLLQIAMLESVAAGNHTTLMDTLQENEKAMQKFTGELTSLQSSLDKLTSQLDLQGKYQLQKMFTIRKELLMLSRKLAQLDDVKVDNDLLRETLKHLEDELSETLKHVEDDTRVKFEELTKRVGDVEWQVREGHMDYIKQLVEETLSKYGIDHVATFDFALENAGGQVIDSSPTYDPSQTRPQLFGITIPISLARSVPTAIIQPQVHPGDCWCFEGNQGFAVVKLVTPAVVTNITLEHIPKNLSPDGRITAAPRHFSAIGKNSLDEVGTLLGNFEYKEDGPSIQTFPVKAKTKASYSLVEFKVKDNHGNPKYTCMYRVRVHGRPSY